MKHILFVYISGCWKQLYSSYEGYDDVLKMALLIHQDLEWMIVEEKRHYSGAAEPMELR